ncbi:MAG: AAA family ATPase [Paludibacter sp.]
MKIVLKNLTLRNFKGVKSESFELSEIETFIHGANGTGKTTLFDSFVWCLFGKDHLGRSDYHLKTWDKSGKTSPKASCEVEAVIVIDDKQTVYLRRVYAENWVKPKGEAEEVFKGNETLAYINDVKVTMTEYNALVVSWCNETVFKSITNPHYFPTLSKDEQRSILFTMAGEITNEQVAGTNQAFIDLLLEITGVSFESYRKELFAKKRRLKDELEGIEPRIDELKRTMPEIPDLDAINKTIEEKTKELEGIEAQISDVSKRSESANAERMKIQEQINELDREYRQIAFDKQKKQQDDIFAVKTKITELEHKNREGENAERIAKQKIEALEKEKSDKTLLLNSLREQYRSISAETLVFSDGEFTCPTCQRLLEIQDIEAKQAKLTENFNNDKAKRIDENKKQGFAVSSRLTEIENELKSVSEPKDSEMFLGTKMDALKEELEKVSYPTLLTPRQDEIAEKINVLKVSLQSETTTTSTEVLSSQRKAIQSEIDELKSKIALKSVVENTNVRIEQLEGQFKTLNQELAGLEKKEFTLKEFEFKKNSEYESRINKMFEVTTFKLFHTQVDGQVIPTCEAVIDGVPYTTQNNALQYYCGLDIIKTLSKFYDKYAPIWIDNREGVTEIPKMDSQVINLVVNSSVEKLTIV